jgi:hypothetical protein
MTREKLREYTKNLIRYNRRTIREFVTEPRDINSLLDCVWAASNAFANSLEDRLELSEVESLLQEGFFEDNMAVASRATRNAEDFIYDFDYEIDIMDLKQTEANLNKSISDIQVEVEKVVESYLNINKGGGNIGPDNRVEYKKLYVFWVKMLKDINILLKKTNKKYSINVKLIDAPAEYIPPKDISTLVL